MARPRVPLLAVTLVVSLVATAAFVGVASTEPARALRRREAAWHHRIAPGDVVLQDLACGVRCDLIREVTHSAYTHVGIVLASDDGAPVVWEAFAPVGPTPLVDFVARGRDEKVAVYRLAPALLARLPAIGAAVTQMRGRPYDGNYQWDDARIYCSELVEKAVQQATGVELASPHALGRGAFGPYATRIAAMSHGILTEETPLTSPLDLARSPHLVRIVDELR